MTGLVRKATLLGVCGLLAAASAWASVPDPANCTVPDWIFVSGKATTPTGGATPHKYCNNLAITTILVKSGPGAGDVIDGATVRIDLDNCCDINYCDSLIWCNIDDGCFEVHPACQSVTGTTGSDGRVSFCLWGYAKDPGSQQLPLFPLCDPGTGGAHCLYGGCGKGGTVTANGPNGAKVFASGGAGFVPLNQTPTVVVFDLNGGALGGSNGPTGADVTVMINQVGAKQLPQPAFYRGRADFNCDMDNTGADVTEALVSGGRGGLYGLKCPGQSGVKTCAGKAPCANQTFP